MTTATVFLLLDCISRCLHMSTDWQSLRQSQSSIRQSLQEVCTVLSRHCLTFLPLLSTNFFSSLKDTLNIRFTMWNVLITWLFSDGRRSCWQPCRHPQLTPVTASILMAGHKQTLRGSRCLCVFLGWRNLRNLPLGSLPSSSLSQGQIYGYRMKPCPLCSC